jgi:hypothetical protein
MFLLLVPLSCSFVPKLSHLANTPSKAKPLELGPLDLLDGTLPAFLLAHNSEAPKSYLSSSPGIGSSLIMLTIVGLLYLWEESVEWLRETVPKTLLPVVESILAEIGGLGFIGLILQSVLGNSAVKEGLRGLSLELFGEEEILVENFEFLHSAFFQVGVGFFVVVGAMRAGGIRKLNEIKTLEGLELDQETGACTATAAKLSQYIPMKEMGEPLAISGGNSLWDEIFMGKEERAARSLLLRNQIMKCFPSLPETFRVESLIQASFAQKLYKLVKVSPLTWIYIIPALALANGIDLSHEVINSASPNAAESVGFFFSAPSAVVPASISVAVSLVWGIWNCWKVTQIKYMLWPRFEMDPVTGETEIVPPLVEFEANRKSFDSSPAWVQPIEGIWGKPATNPLEELFGTAGSSGMKLYQNSIKYQTWLTLTHIVFFGTQIVPRDINAILTGATVGDPSHLTAELVTYGGFVFVGLLQLAFIAPRAFWNYCLIAPAEGRTAEKLLVLSGNFRRPPSAAFSAANSTGTAETLRELGPSEV